MYLDSVEATHRWEESPLAWTYRRASIPNEGLQLTRSKVVKVRNLQPIPMASLEMPTGSLHEIGLNN